MWNGPVTKVNLSYKRRPSVFPPSAFCQVSPPSAVLSPLRSRIDCRSDIPPRLIPRIPWFTDVPKEWSRGYHCHPAERIRSHPQNLLIPTALLIPDRTLAIGCRTKRKQRDLTTRLLQSCTPSTLSMRFALLPGRLQRRMYYYFSCYQNLHPAGPGLSRRS